MKESTEKEIRYALVRIKAGRPKVVAKNRKLSISALAEEAGVADSTIHNRYPEIANEVREIIGKAHKAQRDIKTEQLKAEKTKIRELRKYIEELESDNKNLVTINAMLEDENLKLKAEMSSGKVTRIR